MILVKNLPANTTELEIKDIFSKYGLVSRVILPPSGVTGNFHLNDYLFDMISNFDVLI